VVATGVALGPNPFFLMLVSSILRVVPPSSFSLLSWSFSFSLLLSQSFSFSLSSSRSSSFSSSSSRPSSSSHIAPPHIFRPTSFSASCASSSSPRFLLLIPSPLIVVVSGAVVVYSPSFVLFRRPWIRFAVVRVDSLSFVWVRCHLCGFAVVHVGSLSFPLFRNHLCRFTSVRFDSPSLDLPLTGQTRLHHRWAALPSLGCIDDVGCSSLLEQGCGWGFSSSVGSMQGKREDKTHQLGLLLHGSPWVRLPLPSFLRRRFPHRRCCTSCCSRTSRFVGSPSCPSVPKSFVKR